MSILRSYNEWSRTYDIDENLTRDLDQKVTRELFTNLLFDSVLEIGCGTGKNTDFLAQIGKNVHALDFSQGMIGKAKAKVKAGNVRFSTADLTKRWPCEDGAYDLISCNLVLEHIEDLSHIFTEAARVLESNGKFLVIELHPFKQYEGKKAGFHHRGEVIEVEAFVHNISDFLNSASSSGLTLERLGEHRHETDPNKPPRLVSFLFEKGH